MINLNLDFFYYFRMFTLYPMIIFWISVILISMLSKNNKNIIPENNFKQFFSKQKINIFSVIVINQLLNFVVFFLNIPLLETRGFFEEKIFSIYKIIFEILLLLFFHDFLSYWLHRIAHSKKFYFIHKKHHEFVIVQPYAALYSSFLENIIINILPVSIPMFLFCTHPISVSLTICIIYIHAVHDHSRLGNRLDPLNYFSNNAITHDIHHKYKKCNYSNGLTNTWDRVFDTEYKKIGNRVG